MCLNLACIYETLLNSIFIGASEAGFVYVVGFVAFVSVPLSLGLSKTW